MSTDANWSPVHKFIISHYTDGKFDYDKIINGLVGFQQYFNIRISDNLAFLKNFAELLHKEHKHALMKGEAKGSYPTKLVSAIQSLNAIDYAKQYVEELQEPVITAPQKPSIFKRLAGRLKKSDN